MNLLDKVNNLNKSDFISTFGNIFEKTDWIAEKAYEKKPFNNARELIYNMLEIFENSTKEKHLKILNEHPDLVIETGKDSLEESSLMLNTFIRKKFIIA